MAIYKTPGVFVEEISTFPASVAQVSTAIPAFIGYTELNDLQGIPTRISSFVEYVSLFGNAPLQAGIVINVGGSEATELPVSVTLTVAQSDYKMYHALQMYFANGGGPCYIISVGDYGDAVAKADLDASLVTSGLSLLAKEDEPTLIVFPDATALDDDDCYGLYIDAMAQCEQLKDRFTLVDLLEDSDVLPNSSNPHQDFRDKIGTQNLKYGATYYPWLQTTLTFNYADTAVVVDQPGDTGSGIDGETLDNTTTLSNAFINQAKALISELTVKMPPGSAMAGIYATVDRSRGVWKAPANISLNAVVKPTIKITDAIQEDMNVHTTGKSINAIRTFTGQGTLVWGARTLAGNDNEWRYVPVRRLYIMVEESIKKATEFVVFEPNDANTWVRVRGTIQNFLTGLWRQGALAGAKPEDAFFVKVGLGETMTSLDILEGRLIVEIGMAAVRPAEFIILRFTHKIQES